MTGQITNYRPAILANGQLTIAPAVVRSAIGVYSTSDVDSLLSALGNLSAEDIDTLAEINAVLTDADLASQAYVDTAIADAASDYATTAQGVLAGSALQPSDITSGTITPGTGDIDFDDLGGGLANAVDISGGVLVHDGDGVNPGSLRASSFGKNDSTLMVVQSAGSSHYYDFYTNGTRNVGIGSFGLQHGVHVASDSGLLFSSTGDWFGSKDLIAKRADAGTLGVYEGDGVTPGTIKSRYAELNATSQGGVKFKYGTNTTHSLISDSGAMQVKGAGGGVIAGFGAGGLQMPDGAGVTFSAGAGVGDFAAYDTALKRVQTSHVGIFQGPSTSALGFANAAGVYGSQDFTIACGSVFNHDVAIKHGGISGDLLARFAETQITSNVNHRFNGEIQVGVNVHRIIDDTTQLSLQSYDATLTAWQSGFKQQADPAGVKIGFYDSLPVAKQDLATNPTNAEIASVLSNLGLVTLI